MGWIWIDRLSSELFKAMSGMFYKLRRNLWESLNNG